MSRTPAVTPTLLVAVATLGGLVLGRPAHAWDLFFAGKDKKIRYNVEPGKSISVQVCADKQLADFAKKKVFPGADVPVRLTWAITGSSTWPTLELPTKADMKGPFCSVLGLHVVGQTLKDPPPVVAPPKSTPPLPKPSR